MYTVLLKVFARKGKKKDIIYKERKGSQQARST
jgi:hypothetical protein